MGTHLCIAKKSAAQDTIDGACDLHVGGQGLRCSGQLYEERNSEKADRKLCCRYYEIGELGGDTYTSKSSFAISPSLFRASQRETLVDGQLACDLI
jgi:hypothetical protein